MSLKWYTFLGAYSMSLRLLVECKVSSNVVAGQTSINGAILLLAAATTSHPIYFYNDNF